MPIIATACRIKDVGGLILLLSLLNVSAAKAAVNDVLPGDFFPLATGTSTFAAYAYDRHSTGPYAQGQKKLDGELDTQLIALRFGHFFEFSGKPLSLIALLPWARVTIAPSGLTRLLGEETSGVGDLRLGATQWLVTEREQGRYLAISGMLSLPTGNYERSQVVSIGENRTKLTLSLGWIEPLGNSWVFEMTPELAWYGSNDRYLGNHTLVQKSTFALTGYLRYRATPNWQFHVGEQINRGGATSLDGVDRGDAPDNPRLMLGMTFVSDDRKHQWIVRAARDTAIENGFKNNSELLLRYLRIF